MAQQERTGRLPGRIHPLHRGKHQHQSEGRPLQDERQGRVVQQRKHRPHHTTVQDVNEHTDKNPPPEGGHRAHYNHKDEWIQSHNGACFQ